MAPEYLSLADFLLIGEAVLDVDAEVLEKSSPSATGIGGPRLPATTLTARRPSR
jgi:hypothetical protein